MHHFTSPAAPGVLRRGLLAFGASVLAGAEPAVGPRQQFDEFIKAEVGRWTRVIREARIQPE